MTFDLGQIIIFRKGFGKEFQYQVQKKVRKPLKLKKLFHRQLISEALEKFFTQLGLFNQKVKYFV